MKIRDRIIEALKDGIKTNRELHALIPDKTTRVISATVSENPKYFIRIEQCIVGLRGRDEDKVTGRPVFHDKFCLYKKMVNLLQAREMSFQEMYRRLPNEKRVSIRAHVNMHPELFVKIGRGIVGRRGRDEYLIEKYARASHKPQKMPKTLTLGQKIKQKLQERPMCVEDLHLRIPGYTMRAIRGTLNNNPKFVRASDDRWKLK